MYTVQYTHKPHQSFAVDSVHASYWKTVSWGLRVSTLPCMCACCIVQPVSFGANSAIFLVQTALLVQHSLAKVFLEQSTVCTFCWNSLLVQTLCYILLQKSFWCKHSAKFCCKSLLEQSVDCTLCCKSFFGANYGLNILLQKSG